MGRSKRNRKNLDNMRTNKRSENYKTKAQLKKERKELKRKQQMEKRFLIGLYDSHRQTCSLDNIFKNNTSKLIGTYSTEPEYTMYDLEEEGCVVKPNGATSIKLEVWEVNEEILDKLEIQYNYYSQLEGYEQEYSKKTISSPFGDIIFYTYNDDCKKGQKILDGDWVEYLYQKKICKDKIIEFNNIVKINK